MIEKDEAFVATWQSYRERGKAVYMAGYALIYILVTGAVSLIFRENDAPMKDIFLSNEFLLRLVIFALVGLILAHFKWKSKNKRYDEIKGLK